MAADLPKWLKSKSAGLGAQSDADLPEAELPLSAPEESASPAQFGEQLPAAIAPSEALLISGLRMVRSVTLRVYASDRAEDFEDAKVLLRWLARKGFDAKLSEVRKFAPEPSKRFTFHYQGAVATLTYAPHLD